MLDALAGANTSQCLWFTQVVFSQSQVEADSCDAVRDTITVVCVRLPPAAGTYTLSCWSAQGSRSVLMCSLSSHCVYIQCAHTFSVCIHSVCAYIQAAVNDDIDWLQLPQGILHLSYHVMKS